ncbi:MAG: hypothetical protein WDZ57_03415 [Demequina sp.]
MNPRPVASVATIGLAVVISLVPSVAHAQDYSFPDTCEAIDVPSSAAECTASRIEVSADVDGQVRWGRETAYPRDAFDGFMTQIDGFAGSTEEYLESARDEVETESGVSFDYELTGATVVVTIARSMDIGSEDARMLGVTAEDGVIVFVLATGPVTDANSVTVTTPGQMLESNGTLDGRSATWTAADLQSLSELRAQGEGDPQVDTTRWVVAGGVILILMILMALYVLVWRRRGPDDGQSIDLNPEFAEGDDTDSTR